MQTLTQPSRGGNPVRCLLFVMVLAAPTIWRLSDDANAQDSRPSATSRGNTGAAARTDKANSDQPDGDQPSTAQRTAAAQSIAPLDGPGMQAELERLRKICEKLELASEIRLMEHWLVPDATDARMLYLPVVVDPIKQGARGRVPAGASSGNPAATGDSPSAGHDQW